MEIEVEYLDLNICIVCLEEKPDMTAVEFDETASDSLSNGPVLMKHLWFREDELHFKYVCLECWTVIRQFHEFYVSVEKSHAEVARVSVGGEHLEQQVIKSEAFVEEPQLEPCNQVYDEQDRQQLLELEDDEETIAVQVEHWEQDEAQSGSDETSSGDEFEEGSTDKIQNEETCKRETKEGLTEAEKLEKIYHKPIAEIEEEDEIVRKHCNLVCESCNMAFNTFVDLKRHFRQGHSSKGFLVCCSRTFRKRQRLVEHVKKVNDPNAFHCTICNRSYSNSTGLSLHVTTMHAAPEELRFKCEQCDKSFAKKFQLNAHQVLHVPEEEKSCVCPQCDKAFATNAKLNVHVKLRHQPPKIHVCQVCAKSFKSKVQFDRHCKEHDESHQEIRLQCKICSKWLKNASSLRKHLQRHDGEGQTHECGVCGKQAPNILALQSHITFVHKKEKLFQCEHCPKAFKRQFTLAEHMATHTGEVLYHCPFCVKTFNSSANMHAHKKKHHPKQWEESRRRSELALFGKVEQQDVSYS
uniref:C2H2-type domain-containing protein n=1 Tax=Culex tarsalis TaxID=7177 RepID=A0A1Q3F543_CULTA